MTSCDRTTMRVWALLTASTVGTLAVAVVSLVVPVAG